MHRAYAQNALKNNINVTTKLFKYGLLIEVDLAGKEERIKN